MGGYLRVITCSRRRSLAFIHRQLEQGSLSPRERQRPTNVGCGRAVLPRGGQRPALPVYDPPVNDLRNPLA
eukprot:CAMPEP_0194293212 /NCGR_PEP_ID=MMETSP0169-20130528/47417_1 /TAXON_ID=218684 /ORGANISM="Corethron pennatum, Strain L29A3" /LENGTH=70 /DNA_ID=CAMNT_0039041645 /DNA_START=64 /DNA_END=273 /DNA_ORIENTATION=+